MKVTRELEMFRDYSVFYKNQFVGIFRDYNETAAIRQAIMKVGNASRYTSASKHDFVAVKLGLL